MRTGALLVIVASLTAPALFGQHDDERVDPSQLFRRAMAEEPDFDEQILMLEELVKTHPRSIWADDALWAIGEMYAQKKQRGKAIGYKRQLVSWYPGCHLESYTQALPVYKKSFVPALRQACRDMGQLPAYRGRRMVVPERSRAAALVNPVPVAVAHDLALMYERQGDFVKAARYYRRCLKRLPARGYLTRFVRDNYERIRELAEHQERTGKQKQAREDQPKGK